MADVCPPAIVIRGSVAASSTSELASVTMVPVAGAAALSVTVHVADPPLPPAIDDGLHESVLIPCAYALDVASAHAIVAIATLTAGRCVVRLTCTESSPGCRSQIRPSV